MGEGASRDRWRTRHHRTGCRDRRRPSGRIGTTDAGVRGERPAEPAPRRRNRLIRGGSGELRVATEIVDGVAERSARMRIAAKVGGAAGPEALRTRVNRRERTRRGNRRRQVLTDIGASLRAHRPRISKPPPRPCNVSAKSNSTAALRLQVQPLRPFLRTLARHTSELAGSLGKDVEVDNFRRQCPARSSNPRGGSRSGPPSRPQRRRSRNRGPRDPTRSGQEPPKATSISAPRPTATGSNSWSGTTAGASIPKRWSESAVERGLVNPSAAAHLAPDEAYQLLELPGFTTRDLATDVSGRGVGLDAVAASIRSIGGDLWIDRLRAREPGSPSRFRSPAAANGCWCSRSVSSSWRCRRRRFVRSAGCDRR